MGATPIAGVVTVAIPSSDEMINDAWIKKLSDSVHRVGQSFGCPIVGGDIAVLPEKGQALVLTVTVLATSHGSRVLLRSSAEIGDGVYVTGELGRTLEADGQGHHLHFVPRIELSLSLKEILGEDLHAMIDLSDGLARDVGHIAKASGVGIELEGAMIPRRNGASLHEAIADGEDYELCFTSSSEVNEVNGVPVARVGTVVDAARCHPCSVIVNDGITSHCVDNLGYEHVSRPSNAD
jgi:thiamine-monophosphate kinase